MKNQDKISTKAFSDILYKKLLNCDVINAKQANLLILWLLKYFQIYQSYYLKKTSTSIIERVGHYSRNNSTFILSHSFSSLINYEDKNSNLNINGKIHQLFYEIKSYLYNLFIINRILFSFRSDRILLFCSEKISQRKISSYIFNNKLFSMEFSKCIPVKQYFIKKRYTSAKNNDLSEVIYDLCNKSLSDSKSNTANSEYDYLIDPLIIQKALNHIQEYLPSDLLYMKRSFLKFYINLFPSRSITIVDDYVRVLRNDVIRSIFELFDSNLIGMQHGAQYGEISSFLLTTEIHNPAYYNRFMGWGFGLGNFNFRKKKSEQNKVKINNNSCILFPVSIDSRLIQAINLEEEDHEVIDFNKSQILSVLKQMELKYWVKYHPKSECKDLSNIPISDRCNGGHKPGLDPTTIKLVIFDSPGQSIMYHCLDDNIPFIYCFNPKNFTLTRNGIEFYSKLDDKGQFVNTEFDFTEKLKILIKAKLSGGL